MRHLLRAALTAMLAGVLVPAPAHAQYPPVVSRTQLDPAKGVNFNAILVPDTVYVGQQATYQIGVFLNQEVRQRLRRNPEFVPPETRSLLVYDLPDAKAPLVGTIDGRPYEVHVFQRAFFALTPGRFDIPPSKLTYSLPQSASFFSREETHTLRSAPRALVVLPVPTAGRPDDFAGAVGIWRARLRVDSGAGRVGNPLVLTMRIEGQGNVTLLPRPPLAVDWGTLVTADERVEFDSTPATLRGAKEFDWLLTPREAGRQRIPAQRFSYFNPASRRFEVAGTGALDVAIAAGEPVADNAPPEATLPADVAPAPSPSAVLSLRPTLGGGVSFSWLRQPWYVLLLLLAPLPTLVGVIARRPHRPKAKATAATQLADAARAHDADVALLRRLTHETLRDRLHLDAGLALADGSLVAKLRHEGVTIETARRAETLLRLLDAAAFRGDAASTRPSAAELAALCAAIHSEARGASHLKHDGARSAVSREGTAALLLAAALVIVPPLAARQDDAVGKSWAAGHTAFAGRDYARAERHFLDVARGAPDHPNAWANAGTAAWLAADTARAVQGWQRALRLAPLDREMRDRLALVRAVQDRGPARVPEVPVQLVPLLLLALWLWGWWGLARRAWRRRPVTLRALSLILVGAALGAAAAWLDDIQRAEQFAAIVRPEALRSMPVLGADAGPAPLTGEVARVLERRGAWAQVRLDGQRSGWIAAELLLPLGGN